jgi:hypothetical protein
MGRYAGSVFHLCGFKYPGLQGGCVMCVGVNRYAGKGGVFVGADMQEWFGCV